MTVICPKCKEVINVPDDRDCCICCDEVIYVGNIVTDDEKTMKNIFNGIKHLIKIK